MAISAGTGNNAATAKDVSILPLEALQGESAVLLKQRLTQALQTSLELKTVLELFFQHIQAAVNVGGLHFRNSHSHCDQQLGIQSLQTLSYRLKGAQFDLGELVFSRPKRFSQQEMATLEHLLPTLIFPLRNALLYRDALMSSLTDPLTGLGNRTALSKALSRETRLAQRHREPLSILVIDIDHFKNINDTFGHSCGDDALKQLGAALRSMSRETDQSFRYGGEEFVLLLDKTDLKGARVIAERLRHRISQLQIESREHTLTITASIGVSTLSENDCGDSLFQRADKALYRAKQEGRNRVAVER